MSVPCIRLLGSVFIGIEIDAVDSLILSNLVSSFAETAEHRGHAVEFILAVLAFHLVQGFTDNQHIAIPIWIWMIPTYDLDPAASHTARDIGRHFEAHYSGQEDFAQTLKIHAARSTVDP